MAYYQRYGESRLFCKSTGCSLWRVEESVSEASPGVWTAQAICLRVHGLMLGVDGHRY